jgi:two-component system CheB/CheR fusion protein
LKFLRQPSERRRPIDTLFASLGEELNDDAIGVLLSGADADGTTGLLAIKARGGTTMCQDPSTAGFRTMPEQGIATGAVDYILEPAAIGRELASMARHPLDFRARRSGLRISPDTLRAIFLALRTSTGVDFSVYKLTTTMRRILRRMAVHKVATLRAYLDYLQSNPAEVSALYDDLLIKVTSFFREDGALRVLAEGALPALFAERTRQGDPIRAWVPGCSSGEQAYTLAIILFEYMHEHKVSRPVQIFATDISDEALRRARADRYPAAGLEPLTEHQRNRYFTQNDGGDFTIAKFVRESCVFASQNVICDPPFSHLDMIVCTNLLIYLDTVAQKRLIPIFHYALRPSGWLVLGSSESIGGFTNLFVPMDKRYKIYQRRSAAAEIAVKFPPLEPGGPLETTTEGAPMTPPGPPHDFDLRKEVDRMMLNRYSPPGVVLNAELEVLQFRGRTGQFLEPASGPATHNVLKMAREGLIIDLRAALTQARETSTAARRENVRVRTNSHYAQVNIEVVPMSSPKSSERYFVVTFEAQPYHDPPPDPPKGKRSGRQGQQSPEIERLRRELEESREDLQAIIEEKEAANEELKAANEEIQSSNEELQSTNEELQTAKEELQSANEELTTINEELQTRNMELNEANDDLSNLLSNVTIPVVMLGQDLRIRRFTPMAERLFNLIPGDVGRPFSDINPNVGVEELPKVVGEVLDSLTPRDLHVQDRRGNWYLVRVRPYRTSDKKIDGVVIALFELDELKRSVEREQVTAMVLETAVRMTSDYLLVLDGDSRVIEISQALCLALEGERSKWLGMPASVLPGLGRAVETLLAGLPEGEATAEELDVTLPSPGECGYGSMRSPSPRVTAGWFEWSASTHDRARPGPGRQPPAARRPRGSLEGLRQSARGRRVRPMATSGV